MSCSRVAVAGIGAAQAGWNVYRRKVNRTALADQPRDGPGILDRIETDSGGGVKMGPGTLYGTLHKLAADGLIRETGAAPDPADDDPRRDIRGDGRFARLVARLLLRLYPSAFRARDGALFQACGERRILCVWGESFARGAEGAAHGRLAGTPPSSQA